MPPAQPQLGLVEEDLAAVREGEAEVHQLLPPEVVLLIGVVVVVLQRRDGGAAEPVHGLLEDVGGSLGGQRGEVRAELRRPRGGVEVLRLRQG